VESEVGRRNTVSLERLRAAAARLSPEQLVEVIDPPWTASALFAHIAFWDRFTESRWTAGREAGLEAPASIPDEPLERVNLASLHQWLLLPPELAVQECLAAAESVNALLASLPVDVIESVRQERERLVDRSLHRGDHLSTIEASFGS